MTFLRSNKFQNFYLLLTFFFYLPDPLKQLHPDPKNCIEGNHPEGIMYILTDDAPGVLDLPGAELTGEHPGQNLAAPVVLSVLGPAQQVRLRGVRRN
jgi:hypothetical protein